MRNTRGVWHRVEDCARRRRNSRALTLWELSARTQVWRFWNAQNIFALSLYGLAADVTFETEGIWELRPNGELERVLHQMPLTTKQDSVQQITAAGQRVQSVCSLNLQVLRRLIDEHFSRQVKSWYITHTWALLLVSHRQAGEGPVDIFLVLRLNTHVKRLMFSSISVTRSIILLSLTVFFIWNDKL